MKQQEENIVRSNNVGLFYRYVNSRVKYRRSIGAQRRVKLVAATLG